MLHATLAMTTTPPTRRWPLSGGDDGTVVAYFGDADRAGGAHGNLTGGFYRSYGPSVLNLRRDCSAPILKSGAVSNGPGVFPHNVWLMATWTDDGTTVHGLVHDEYTPNATDTTLCPGGFNKKNPQHVLVHHRARRGLDRRWAPF